MHALLLSLVVLAYSDEPVYSTDCRYEQLCDKPPNAQCFETSGTCRNGRCTYSQKAEGDPCDDGIPATVNDQCDSQGFCNGTDFEEEEEEEQEESSAPSFFGEKKHWLISWMLLLLAAVGCVVMGCCRKKEQEFKEFKDDEPNPCMAQGASLPTLLGVKKEQAFKEFKDAEPNPCMAQGASLPTLLGVKASAV